MKKITMMFLGAALTVTGYANADQPVGASSGQLLASTNVQDEIDRLPADNLAYFTASREVKLQLDLLADMDDGGSLSDAIVTVVRPNGSKVRLRPDATGAVTLTDAQPGAHAIVATKDGAHGTTLLYMDRKEGNATPTKRVTMLKVASEELRDPISRVRGLSSGSSLVRSSVRVDPVYDYNVTLGPSGTLNGRVLSLDPTVSLAGTYIAVYYGGQRVGNTTADSAGNFQITDVRPGVHGIIASGRAGYSAFAFNALPSSELAMTNSSEQTFVAAQVGDVVPVVLVPPQLTEPVVETVQEEYPVLAAPVAPGGVSAPLSGITGGLPMGSFGAPGVGGPGLGGPAAGGPAAGGPGAAGGVGGGLGGAGAGAAGGIGGGLGGLAGLAGVGAAVAATTSNDDDNVQAASPATP